MNTAVKNLSSFTSDNEPFGDFVSERDSKMAIVRSKRKIRDYKQSSV